ncbi:SNF2 family N-terminal domain [Babesia microti strain RI]|uniref:SNF2 family N-terminal domain n=1 Tax=Babesia microti (strain RI) TaxID=1133968 RepID=A0A1R4AB41_BABMR|nr:SNF2 family N-terminal domain [Babesia microti strain RI]SJK86232.1 SNF2 family N-terminal domain [Babesia microti strain RI]|eukprot:XP_021338415.1 SNF2 family N-terminal domain [Babesia microti strain RI]
MGTDSNGSWEHSNFNNKLDCETNVSNVTTGCSEGDNDSHFFVRKKRKQRVLMDSDESSSESSDSAQSTISSTTDSALSELIEALKYTNLVAKNLIQLFKFSSHDLLNFSLSNAKLYDDEIFAGAPKYHLLKEYQKRSVSWLLSLNSLGLGCILADEMGLGKTAQIAVFLSLLYSDVTAQAPLHSTNEELPLFCTFGRKLPSIIAVPASILDHWMNELCCWAPNIANKCIKYHGTPQMRRGLAYEKLSTDNVSIIVTTTSMISSREDMKLLRSAGSLECLIVDEAHLLKNSESLVYKSLDRAFDIRQRILLTGTPLQNRITELSSLLNFVLPFDTGLAFHALNDEIEENFVKYKRNSNVDDTKIFEELEEFIQKIKPSNDVVNNSISLKQKAIQQLISPFVVRRLKCHVIAELPPKSSYIIRVPLKGLQKELYDKEIEEKDKLLIDSSACGADKNLETRMGIHEMDTQPDTQSDIQIDKATTDIEKIRDDEQGHVPESDSSCKGRDTDYMQRRRLKFIKSILFRLRRITNHPFLTVGSYYSKEQVNRVIDYFRKYVEGFRDQTQERVASEISSWCDYEIHQSIRDLGQTSISDLMIPSEQLIQGAKLEKLIELLSTLPHEKTLIFSHFSNFLDIIHETLSVLFPNLPLFRLDGQVKITDRVGLLKDFTNVSGKSVMLISTKTGGSGLNLIAATCVIIMDHDWNPHNDIQAEDRIHRIGQKKPVSIYRICCKDTIEERILAAWVEKLKLNNAFGGDSTLLLQAIQHGKCLDDDIQQL